MFSSRQVIRCRGREAFGVRELAPAFVGAPTLESAGKPDALQALREIRAAQGVKIY